MIKRICRTCGDAFYVSPSRPKRGMGIYCSAKCRCERAFNKYKTLKNIICSKCGKRKTIDNFRNILRKQRGKKRGFYLYYKPVCKECLSANFREWAKRNIEHLRERDKQRRNNPKRKEWQKKYAKEYRKIKRADLKQYFKEYHKKHAAIIIAKATQWKKEHPEQARQWNTAYKAKRRKADINYRIEEQLRGRIYGVLRGRLKTKRTMDLIGCSIETLKKHLSANFKKGMSWENYGEWHIDHIRPCASFDLTKPKQQKICFNYRNLHILWEYDNLSKGATTTAIE